MLSKFWSFIRTPACSYSCIYFPYSQCFLFKSCDEIEDCDNCISGTRRFPIPSNSIASHSIMLFSVFSFQSSETSSHTAKPYSISSLYFVCSFLSCVIPLHPISSLIMQSQFVSHSISSYLFRVVQCHPIINHANMT
jgi:hypothetical protein